MTTAQLLPEDLLHELGVAEPQDLDIEAIAYYCGAEVRYAPLSVCAARIIGTGDRAIITIDASQGTPARQRFSIGHELGHWMRDRGRSAYLCEPKDMNSPWRGRTDRESLANQYAADLLMPRFLFKPRSANLDMTFTTVRFLADEFRTSRTATAVRLVELGSYPAMLICHGREGRRWFSRGVDVPDSLWPTKELSHETAAFELLFGDRVQQTPREVDADAWVSHRDSYRYSVVEDSIKVADDAIVTLIWWKDESQLLDLG